MDDDIDRDSGTRKRIKAWLDARRDASLAVLTQRGVSPTDTEFHRGLLAALRELEDLLQPPKS
ncbi:MAG: hypothetical protein HQL56_06870 [Magnetococcales bacterium]|nr:hypothetical protein [Magnetococcales bacterium]